MSEKKIVPEHNETINISFTEHYEAHEKRTESELFRKVKKAMHEEKVPCYIGNGKCSGQIEIHHSIIEWSANTEIDWIKVEKDHPGFTNVDQRYQMMALCEKHHRGAGGFGIHTTPYPVWILQKYMLPEALDDFENAVKAALKNKHKGE